MNETTEGNDSKNIDVEGELEVIEGETTEAKAERLENLNKQLFARAKKAEGFTLKDGKWVKAETKTEEKPPENKSTEAPKNDSLTPTDLYAVINAKVPEEDLGDVQKYAKMEGITVAEALKSDIVKTILADKAEKRKTAEGTNVNGGKRGNAKLSDEALLSNAEKGILPDSDQDMQRLSVLQRKKGK